MSGFIVRRPGLHRLTTGIKKAFPDVRLRRLVRTRAIVPTQVTIEERLCLYDSAVHCLTQSTSAGRFIEVGSYVGGSSVVLAEALRRYPLKKPQLFCVDTWQNDAMSEGARDTFSQFCETVEPWKDLVTPLRGRSTAVAVPSDEPIDLVFIDADHTYIGCLADVDRYAYRLRKGGILALHDHAWYAGVAKVVGELLQSGRWRVVSAVGNLICLVRDDDFATRNGAVSSGGEATARGAQNERQGWRFKDRPKELVLTTYLTGRGDPQGGRSALPDDPNMMANWLPGLERNGLTGVVFHDELSDEFTSAFSKRGVWFVRSTCPRHMSVNDYRFVIWRDWLAMNPVEKVFCTDLFDVRINRNPFALIDNSVGLLISHEREFIDGVSCGGSWMTKRLLQLYGCIPASLSGKRILNAGVWGGWYSEVMRLLTLVDLEFRNMESLPYNSNMAAFNRVLYEEIGESQFWSKGAPLHSEYKAYQTDADVCFVHK